MDSVQSQVGWNVVDIVYLSMVGPIMVCALVEWFLWLSAFCYCLSKAFKKADHWSSRLLVILMLLLFVILRYETRTIV